MGIIRFDVPYGCIRMFNKDIEKLYENVKYGITVT
ncbi:L,D-transpeptidase family protein [Clostridium saccharobutylicum]|nr:lipoprotein-anchoring transpeptidase ErfK/SrfK [Clostridium saccharobutylicum]MBA8983377.1 lipoprotein-anchoring transpeptidase ErfK/SrfK [Clostridium saccharobutylicum]NOV74864.1 lipoprotein-anchoring transpeptidase ErfK/SrfK [Clostridium saccharobutylicum]NOV79378.1 lipoprotein-anchoring transpeptidase ErfK/SrfK [Clostridium saccharobutylicum]NOW09451.1 lipoprotein-anchoring transpeptidase ErfK/SrfK [Clostridium saccharobutylicum]